MKSQHRVSGNPGEPYHETDSGAYQLTPCLTPCAFGRPYRFNRRYWDSLPFNRAVAACASISIVTFAELRA